MSQTTTSQRSAGLPIDEPIMVRYSPHHEFPLSTVTSVGLHALVIALLVIAGIVIAKLNWGGDQPPLPTDAVALEEGGGGGHPQGFGKGPGDGSLGDPEAPDAPLPDPDQPFDVAQPREKLQEARKEALQLPEFKDEEGQRLIEEGGQQVDKILRLKSDVRKKLNAALAGKGEGGSGRGGGRGTGTGTGEGGGVGPGKGQASDRAKRVLRWTLVFNTRDGNDYRRQLQAFGAIIAIPNPRNPDDYLVIRDLEHPTPQPEDISKIQRIYWIDDGAASIRSLSSVLGLSPPPPHFVVFFPAEFEEKLLKLELAYRGKKENEISETRFDVRRSGGTYEPVVISQR